jgi:hypothetical protein
MSEFDLRSPAFEDGGVIPRQYGYRERNVNPPLVVEAVPPETVSLAFVVEDPDAVAPAGKVWDHWVVWNVSPAETDSRLEIPEGWDPASAGGQAGTNDYGERGYGGPNPPDREHTYLFRAYALDTTLGLAPSATKEELEDAVGGHVLETATLRGRYAP